MVELNSYFFYMLKLAKAVHDDPRLKKTWPSFGCIPLDEDSFYELFLETAISVFKGTDVYYNDETGVETWVLRDPVIDRFCELCAQLEREKGLDEWIDPYRRNAERMIHEGFRLSCYGYDYDWRLSAEQRGSWRVLFYVYEDFYGMEELPTAFLDVLYGFQELNRQLEAELGLNKIIPIYPLLNEWKEAA